MKKGWQPRRLGDLLKVQNGYAFDSKGFSASDGMPLIRIRDLKKGTETETRFTGDYEDKYLVRAGDLLVGMDGEFGCFEWKGGLALLNQRVCRLQGFASDLMPRFLFYGVNSHLKAIEDVTGFATVKHLSSKQILGIEFPIPPLREQQRIVCILDEAFEGIATAKANAEKNLQNARALFESHLESVFTQRGGGWVEKKLGDLIAIQNGFAFRSTEYTDSGYFVMRIGNVQDGYVTLSNPKYVQLTDRKLEQFVLNKDDVLISLTGNIGRVGILQDEHLPAVLNQRVARITVSSCDADRDFIFRFLSSRTFRESLQEAGHGAAQQNVSTKEIKSVKICLPDIGEQRRVVERFDPFAVGTEHLEFTYQQKLAALEVLKKSILHQAFTGQLGAQAA